VLRARRDPGARIECVGRLEATFNGNPPEREQQDSLELIVPCAEWISSRPLCLAATLLSIVVILLLIAALEPASDTTIYATGGTTPICQR